MSSAAAAAAAAIRSPLRRKASDFLRVCTQNPLAIFCGNRSDPDEGAHRDNCSQHQTRRSGAVVTTAPPKRVLEEATCVGWSGGPLFGATAAEEEAEPSPPDHQQRRTAEEAIGRLEGRGAFLLAAASEVGGSGGVGYSYYGGKESWAGGRSLVPRSEEMEVDGVDEALAIAEAMWNEARFRGVPDWPQAQVLRRMGRL